MSVAWPSKPEEGWCIRIRLLGSAERLPCAPPASSSEPIDIAMPTHIVLHVGLDEVHRVEDREPGVDRAAGRVDVERDVLLRVDRLQVQQLRDDDVRDLVVDREPRKMMRSLSSRE